MQRIFEDVAKEYDITPNQVEFAYESAVRALFNFLRDGKSIVIHNMGRWIYNRTKVVKRFFRMQKKYLEGDITREEFKKKVKWLWPRYQAAIAHKPGKGHRYIHKLRKAKQHAESTGERFDATNIIAYPEFGV